jgi:hypothetical protein
MSKRGKLSCKDCYFRQASLCALQLDHPCPTFRLADNGALGVPRQAQLIPRRLETVAAPARFVAQHQAA